MSTVGDVLPDAPEEYRDIKLSDLKLKTTPGDRKNFPATNQVGIIIEQYISIQYPQQNTYVPNISDDSVYRFTTAGKSITSMYCV